MAKRSTKKGKELELAGNIFIPNFYLEENATKAIQGIEFLAEDYYSAPIINVDNVRHAAKDVPVVASNLEKYRRFIFTDLKINVLPPVDVQVSADLMKDVQQRVNELDTQVIKTSLRMNQAWYDRIVYGSSIFEYKTGTFNDWLKVPIIFKHLPAHSFDTLPSARSDINRYIHGDILLGIIYDNETGEYEYWQRQTQAGTPIKLDSRNILHIKDDVSDAPDGKSRVAQILSLVQKLKFAEKAAVQTVNRAGAPGLWASVEEYRNEVASNPEAWSFAKAFEQAKKIVKNHGKDTVIVAPSCIKLQPLDYRLAIDPLKVIDHYERRILHSLVAKDFTEQTAQAISVSANPGFQLLILMAQSEQDELSIYFKNIWKEILEANNLDGWNVEIQFRDLSPASDDQLYARAKIAAETGILTTNEIRVDLLGFPEITPGTGLGIAPPDPKSESPKGETDEEAESKTAISENSEVNTKHLVKDLLKLKGREFMEYCIKHNVKPWEINRLSVENQNESLEHGK